MTTAEDEGVKVAKPMPKRGFFRAMGALCGKWRRA
jgi:hypothetical protein